MTVEGGCEPPRGGDFVLRHPHPEDTGIVTDVPSSF